ncbi:MAG: transcription termination factor NusA [Gammaproteobacteria bacterium]|jgi:N utilization substance protein A|nr:transcription termination factor NusA [Gammaproteobacteria bacterium]
MHEEILMMADALSREKSVEKDIVFDAIEAALATATRKRHEGDIDVRVAIHQDTGDYDAFRRWEVMSEEEEIEFPERQYHLEEARQHDPEIEVGGFIEVPLEPVSFGRIAAQAAKQVIMQKIREAERQRIVEEYEDRKGEMITGVVKRMERGDAIVDVGGAEAKLEKSRMIPREGLRPGDRIRGLLEDVRSETRGPQLFLSRTDPRLLIELFKLEVPEAGEGLIVIHAAARDAGIRAKIAVSSKDPKLDPVGACVGIRGSRVQSVSNEIAGERVDIIKWSDDPAQFVISALQPAEVESILVDEDTSTMDVTVDEAQLSQAIGRGGQNVRLASELTGWEINIMTEEEANEKTNSEMNQATERFMAQLDVGEDVAGILVQEGFTTLEEIAYVPRQELLGIEEFDEDLTDELRSRAEDALLTTAIAQEEKLHLADPEADLLEVEGVDEHMARVLASQGVRSRDDLADLATDELLEIKDLEGMTPERASELIMAARAHWFEDEPEAEQAEPGKEDAK